MARSNEHFHLKSVSFAHNVTNHFLQDGFFVESED